MVITFTFIFENNYSDYWVMGREVVVLMVFKGHIKLLLIKEYSGTLTAASNLSCTCYFREQYFFFCV